MTWATIHYVSDSTIAVEFGYAETQKDAIKRMAGAEWDKSGKRWLVPLGKLGDVVKLFFPSVTLDYAVLRARDEQMIRMFEGYMAMGIRFDVAGGKVVCDNPLINEHLSASSTALHVNALQAAQRRMTCEETERPRIDVERQIDQMDVSAQKIESRPVSVAAQANGDIGLWLRGVVNASKAAERKSELLRRKRGR